MRTKLARAHDDEANARIALQDAQRCLSDAVKSHKNTARLRVVEAERALRSARAVDNQATAGHHAPANTVLGLVSAQKVAPPADDIGMALQIPGCTLKALCNRLHTVREAAKAHRLACDTAEIAFRKAAHAAETARDTLTEVEKRHEYQEPLTPDEECVYSAQHPPIIKLSRSQLHVRTTKRGQSHELRVMVPPPTRRIHAEWEISFHPVGSPRPLPSEQTGWTVVPDDERTWDSPSRCYADVKLHRVPAGDYVVRIRLRHGNARSLSCPGIVVRMIGTCACRAHACGWTCCCGMVRDGVASRFLRRFGLCSCWRVAADASVTTTLAALDTVHRDCNKDATPPLNVAPWGPGPSEHKAAVLAVQDAVQCEQLSKEKLTAARTKCALLDADVTQHEKRCADLKQQIQAGNQTAAKERVNTCKASLKRAIRAKEQADDVLDFARTIVKWRVRKGTRVLVKVSPLLWRKFIAEVLLRLDGSDSQPTVWRPPSEDVRVFEQHGFSYGRLRFGSFPTELFGKNVQASLRLLWDAGSHIRSMPTPWLSMRVRRGGCLRFAWICSCSTQWAP